MLQLLSRREQCPQTAWWQGEVADSFSWWTRLGLSSELDSHTGCVNHISFNDTGVRCMASYCMVWPSPPVVPTTGDLLVSGSDDLHICVWDLAAGYKLRCRHRTKHSDNIFCTRFMPSTGGESEAVLLLTSFCFVVYYL